MDQIDAILNRDWEAATQRGKETLAGPLAESACYDQPSGEVVVQLNNGAVLRIQSTLLQGLENATPEEMADIHIGGRGTGLHFPHLDADFYVPALVEGVYGTPAWMHGLKQKLARQKTVLTASGRRLTGVRHQKKPGDHRNVS